MYTDGVIESRDEAGACCPLTERLTRWVGEDPGTLVRPLKGDLLAHGGGSLGDDAAVVAPQRTPKPADSLTLRRPPFPGRVSSRRSPPCRARCGMPRAGWASSSPPRPVRDGSGSAG
ncbi:SpoIIE family protein phosphatase [Streptomyces sp. NPDC007025]|uniref:SpoIIE family protein phosphatase n=1 Tax=Streptomyces sp. NPDC007025 TaxID=3364771 RepID=UPI00368F69BF